MTWPSRPRTDGGGGVKLSWLTAGQLEQLKPSSPKKVRGAPRCRTMDLRGRYPTGGSGGVEQMRRLGVRAACRSGRLRMDDGGTGWRRRGWEGRHDRCGGLKARCTASGPRAELGGQDERRAGRPAYAPRAAVSSDNLPPMGRLCTVSSDAADRLGLALRQERIHPRLPGSKTRGPAACDDRRRHKRRKRMKSSSADRRIGTAPQPATTDVPGRSSPTSRAPPTATFQHENPQVRGPVVSLAAIGRMTGPMSYRIRLPSAPKSIASACEKPAWIVSPDAIEPGRC